MSAWNGGNWGSGGGSAGAWDERPQGGGGSSPAWDAGYAKDNTDYDGMAKKAEENDTGGQGFGFGFGDDGPAGNNDGGSGGADHACFNCGQPG